MTYQVEFIILTLISCLCKYLSICSLVGQFPCMFLWKSFCPLHETNTCLLLHKMEILGSSNSCMSFFFQEIKMTDTRNVINLHISHSLLPNIPSIFLPRGLLSLPLLGQQPSLSCSHLFLRPLRPSPFLFGSQAN